MGNGVHPFHLTLLISSSSSCAWNNSASSTHSCLSQPHTTDSSPLFYLFHPNLLLSLSILLLLLLLLHCGLRIHSTTMDPRNIHLPILPLLLLLPLLSSALFSPADNQLFDCGSTSPSTTLSDHRVFHPDSRIVSDGVRLRSADSNPNLNPLYRTARVFTAPSSYRFQIKHKGTHILRLHFYPFSSNLSSAHFHVIADNDVLLLSNFASDSSSAAPSPTLKEYLLRVDTDSLLLSFVPADPSTLAFVNAIELFSAPADLLPDQARLVGPTLNEAFNGLSYQALETLYRINVAGPKVTPLQRHPLEDMAPRLPLHHPGRPRLEGRHVQRPDRVPPVRGQPRGRAGQRVQLRQGQRRLQHDLGVPGGPRVQVPRQDAFLRHRQLGPQRDISEPVRQWARCLPGPGPLRGHRPGAGLSLLSRLGRGCRKRGVVECGGRPVELERPFQGRWTAERVGDYEDQ
ncbi:putative receptor-like protein kinase [Iris pallida]|uniref:Receptor-like protein kinase n=1 Tax=Iris pallida TaxID=29817 RepID=A0AAX6HP58_IRIPA|nr:putative receptor-like protein kinase [Iris pallida]